MPIIYHGIWVLGLCGNLCERGRPLKRACLNGRIFVFDIWDQGCPEARKDLSDMAFTHTHTHQKKKRAQFMHHNSSCGKDLISITECLWRGLSFQSTALPN